MDKKKRRLDEFCVIGKLEKHRNTLQAIFDKIDEAGCSISTRSDKGPSIHEFSSLGKKCRIRISIEDYSSDPIKAIWVILHEFGHHQSGTVSNQDYKDKSIILKREIKAWQLAREELLSYPELAIEITEFDIYTEKCLKGYREDSSNI